MKKLFEDSFKHFVRTGSIFWENLRLLEVTEKFSSRQLQELQKERLQKIVRFAYENVPYYKTLFRKLKLLPNDIQSVTDLQKLPILDKNVVRENFRLFKSKNLNLMVFKGLTSGTTGSPMIFLRDMQSICFENAALWRHWRWGGKEFSSKRATLRGEVICPIDKVNGPFWRSNYFSRELLLSSYHITEKNAVLYKDILFRYQPFDLYAYPSTAYLLAILNLRLGLKLRFNAVFTSSEMVFDYQKTTIEQSFGCQLFDWYGQAERTAAIAQCEFGKYHELPDYSIIEYLPVGNNEYEIVGTSLFNFVMPLIRYRTGDTVEFDHNLNCRCGRDFRVIKHINGRSGNSIVTDTSARVTAATLTHIPRGVDHLVELQFVQISLNEVVLKIVCADEFSSSDEKRLIINAREHISKNINFLIEKVTSIERGKNGKFIPVISRLGKTNV